MDSNAPVLELTSNELADGRDFDQCGNAGGEAVLSARAKLEERFRRAFTERVRPESAQSCDRVV
jgi:hypothetical protein